MTGSHYAIVPAAGVGARVGSQLPKQFITIGHRTVLDYTLQALLSCSEIKHIVVILSPSHVLYENQIKFRHQRISILHEGGDTRAHTVLNGLRYLSNRIRKEDWILVHDAARPCLELTHIEGLFKELNADPVGGILALPISDTVKESDQEGRVIATRDRQYLWAAQTPQMFRYGLLNQALSMAQDTMTDEASAVERLGLCPKLVLGSKSNIKITYPEDLALAEYILRRQERYE
ncbi:2-C-methyl-D-erythritol 4-phosphate cytidylyltransferase [Ferrovum sp. JA12]|uniref:2-C-methyl-D-erythritol 4-phosphate cytidylyltransferase n=1 Tax=Ferrovum sp. JA12 TaxID=1356299 RepID=UPI000702FB53|nr:2-C-methyl-D-erythritol 4-phosphate cytidylyltransferase [Ferrovum sp. JA12]KRH78873.1 2-C-methyl-D-erythritol 4-phosphate cytidylyltransferase [Ferrovum sp. JA12]